MSGGRFRCNTCGDWFNPLPGALSDYEEGYTGPPDICDECSDMMNCPEDNMIDTFSDADPGL